MKDKKIVQEVQAKFGDSIIAQQQTRDNIPTLWANGDVIRSMLRFLKSDIPKPYRMLYDVTAIDERPRLNKQDQPDSDFTVLYLLLSFERDEFIRLKVPTKGDYPSVPTITDVWTCADWYEREIWDMFGITFEGHPHLTRILMPPTWRGHPLRKEHPARATDMEPFTLPERREEEEQEALKFHPEDWGMSPHRDDTDFLFLNLGPQHPGTHGLLRVVLELDGEEIIDAVLDIGFHHRGAEKMGERQSWHTYIPYTDRVDYLGGVMNNLAYVLAVEQLVGMEAPDKAKVIRVMLAELFRIASHLVWYGTFAQDLGALSPVFYMFTDRERVFDIIEAVCGGRMHPSWFRIGGVAQDLPEGWDKLVRDFLNYFPNRLADYDNIVMRNRIFKARTQGIGSYTLDEAIEWGVTGPGLRACGFEWDFRRKMPYSAYEQFDFDIPTARQGDCFGRAQVRVEEMRQSLRIIEQCMKNMPGGPYKSDHPLTTPPLKQGAMHDIETLIAHFLSVSWGPVIPAGEAFFNIEATKGGNAYYLISDGSTVSYRTRIRTPSFPHLQMVPLICRHLTVSDLLAILGSVDYVLADVDR